MQPALQQRWGTKSNGAPHFGKEHRLGRAGASKLAFATGTGSDWTGAGAQATLSPLDCPSVKAETLPDEGGRIEVGLLAAFVRSLEEGGGEPESSAEISSAVCSDVFF